MQIKKELTLHINDDDDDYARWVAVDPTEIFPNKADQNMILAQQ